MKSIIATASFSIIFFITGYFSWDVLIHCYLGGNERIVTDLHLFLLIPFMTAFLWLILFLLSRWFFEKISNPSFTKDMLFNSLYLLANVFMLVIGTKLAIYLCQNALDNMAVTHIKGSIFIALYLSSFAMTFIVFSVLRRKY